MSYIIAILWVVWLVLYLRNKFRGPGSFLMPKKKLREILNTLKTISPQFKRYFPKLKETILPYILIKEQNLLKSDFSEVFGNVD